MLSQPVRPWRLRREDGQNGKARPANTTNGMSGGARRDRTASKASAKRLAALASSGLTRGPDRTGGARRDRTDDLLLAKQALSQLSYGPLSVVGPGRVELPTSRLSGVRSNHLSYGPPFRRSGKLPARVWPDPKRPDQERPRSRANLRPRRKRNEDGGVPPKWPLDGGPCI